MFQRHLTSVEVLDPGRLRNALESIHVKLVYIRCTTV